MPQLSNRNPRKKRPIPARKLEGSEIKAMRQIAHRVVDQLTAVSGYSQLALERRAAQLGVCDELNKIRSSAEKAVAMIRLALVHLTHLEGMDG